MRMRWVLCVAMVVGAGGRDGDADDAPGPADPGSLDSVVAQATHDGKPLIVEFYTTWCVPCKEFEARVLPDPKVRAELANVRFVRYDAERGSGIGAAEKLRVNAYPTFLALDDHGEVRSKTTGADPGEPAWFVDFLQRAGVLVQSEDRVLAARRRAPGDARLAEATGRWYLEHDRPADALPHFDAAVAADRNGALGIAAEAAWEAAGIRRAIAARTQLARELTSYVRRYPGGKHAVEAVTLVTVGAHPAPAERRALWQAVVDAHKASVARLNDIVYNALAAGELDAALTAAKRQVELSSGSANSYDTLAEVHHMRHEKAEALASEDQGLALLKDDAPEKSGMQANRARFAADGFAVDEGVTAIQRQFAGRWKQLGSLEARTSSDTMTDFLASMNAYRAAKNEVLGAAGKACAAHAGKLTEAYARIDLGGAEPAITVLEPDASPALKRCLVDNLRKASYPKRPQGQPAKSVDRVPLKETAPAVH